MAEIKSGQIMSDMKKEIKCCRHKNLVPLEYAIAKRSFPNGYKEPPQYHASNMVSADTLRVRMYLCLDCKCEVKAPEPGSCMVDRL